MRSRRSALLHSLRRSFYFAWLPLAVLAACCATLAQTQSAPDSAQIPASTFDASSQSAAILAHLNTVLHFYRDASASIQKVGEPSDIYYRDQVAAQAVQIAGYAFESANAEAKLMGASANSGQSSGATSGSAAKIAAALRDTQQRIAQLKTEDAALDAKIAAASPRTRAALQQQLTAVDGELQMRQAIVEALDRIKAVSGNAGGSGIAAQISQLERSAPGIGSKKPTAAPPTLESLSGAHTMGVTSQAHILFQLLHALQAIRSLTEQSARLNQQATALRAPLIDALKKTIAQGQTLAAPPIAAPAVKQARGKRSEAVPVVTAATTGRAFNDLTRQFKQLSAATVPLSQEILVLEQNQASLTAWSNAVDQEYDSVLQSLLLRVVLIAIALLIIFGFSEAWRRGTKRYVRDMRRRRQLLIMRRFVTGFLMVLVIIFGLVTQFSSLATFAGLITAGVAVGLQTILLSIAAYFFIVGRYGIKAGDRITIAGVTGDVVEVGLVRFYVMEMSGSGTDLYPTGRVVVFTNAVLFQATTPLYKQMPGTEFAWHELRVKLTPEADYRHIVEKFLKLLEGVYDGYRSQIERQHRSLEAWMDSNLDAPDIRSSVQLMEGGPQFCARFPVTIREASSIDGKMTAALLDLIATDETIKAVVAEPPVIKAAVRV